MFSQRYTLTVSYQMHRRLEEERKRRCLESVPETIRAILSEYIASRNWTTTDEVTDRPASASRFRPEHENRKEVI